MRNNLVGLTIAMTLILLPLHPGARAQNSGYYTLDQATAGADIYQAKCASCHGAQMEGYIGPSLRGHAFQVITSRQTDAGRLLLIISRNEPENNPGALSEDEDANVLAYILQVNGYPAGKEKLSAESSHLRELNLNR
ncbi:MAG TPA: cytochrome c [Rhizomicrobium sp.]|nr:cytochrome c [Rhizomicrobium sp.]